MHCRAATAAAQAHPVGLAAAGLLPRQLGLTQEPLLEEGRQLAGLCGSSTITCWAAIQAIPDIRSGLNMMLSTVKVSASVGEFYGM
jgi:hypothetical protein